MQLAGVRPLVGWFDTDSGLAFDWDVDMWNLADNGQDARWPDSQNGCATKRGSEAARSLRRPGLRVNFTPK